MKEKAIKKQSFLNRKKAEWKEMKLWNADELCRVDWIVSILILTVLFFTCVHSDVKLTGNRSFLMYKHFTDFYQASYEQSGGYWANYLPSTFIAYAIWNLPLYLTGHAPEAILTNSFVNLMWYKLLPVIIYFITAQLIYHIGKEMGFGEKKSLLCFAALLLLKEKKIRNLIRYTLIMAVPLMVEILPNLSSDAFRRNVFGFSALEYVKKPFSVGFFSGINLMAAVAAFVLVWAYQKKVDKDATASWAVFFCVAVSFSVFGFSTWNPQWVLLMAPFLVLNIFMNENGNLLLMITNIFMLAMYIFCSQSMVDERVLNGGILKYILKDRNFAVRMWDVYRFHDQELLCTAMWIVLLLYVVFGHPRYHSKKGSTISRGLVWQIRAAFLFGVAAFVLPMSVCAMGVLQGKTVFFDNSRQNMEMENVVMLERDHPIIQELTADGKEITGIKIRVYTETNLDLYSLKVVLRDKDSGEVLYESEGDTYGLKENTALYSFLKHSVEVENGKTYQLEIATDAPQNSGIGLYCVTAGKSPEQLVQPHDEEHPEKRSLQMCVTGIE